jgi:hypothetical protein
VIAAIRDALEGVAGPRAFARGEAYALDGRCTRWREVRMR